MYEPTLKAVRRADQVFYEQISEKPALEYGLAFNAVEFPGSHPDNAMREVWIERPEHMAAAWDEAESFYDELGLTCWRWIPSEGQDVDILSPFLQEQGMQRRAYTAMHLSQWPTLQVHDAVRVLPARAMRRAFRQLQVGDADLAERRLDYSQYDVFVATLNNQPVGFGGFLQVGEIGCIRDVYVVPEQRRQGIGRTLIQSLSDYAHRVASRLVCLRVASEGGELRFFELCGFEAAGELIEFHRS